MKVKFIDKLKKTGAIIATTTIVLSSVFSFQSVHAKSNEQHFTTPNEIYEIIVNEESNSKLNLYISSGNNIEVLVDMKNKTDKSIIEVKKALESKNNNLQIQYTGNKIAKENNINKVYLKYSITKDNNCLEKGIDVSEWQGTINWDEVSKHIDFAILRVMDAVKKDSESRFLIDKQFLRNIRECERLNIPVGAYWFSRATTSEEAKKEANFVASILKNYTLEYPTYIDIECEEQLSLDNKTLQNIIIDANTEIAGSGLYPAIYINNSQSSRVEELPYPLWLTSGETYNNQVPFSEFSKENFKVVYNPNLKKSNYQYSQRGVIKGIEGEIDIDYALSYLPNTITNSTAYKLRIK